MNLSFQVSNCLWILDVTVLVIDMKHAEMRNGKFCCCDKNKCGNSLSELGMCEEGNCDLLLSATFSPCIESTSPAPCSVFTEVIPNAENFGDYSYFFNFTTTSQANNVRKCYVLCNRTINWRVRTRVVYNPQTKNVKFCMWSKKALKFMYTLLANMHKFSVSNNW